MTIFSSIEPKFVFFYRNHLEKYFAQLVKRSFTFRSFVSAVGSLFWPELFRPRVVSICPSFWPDRGRDKQQLASFRAHFLNLFQRLKRDQFRVTFNVEHDFFSKLVKVNGFRDFFLGGGVEGQGSDDVIVSDRFSSEKFSNPVWVYNIFQYFNGAEILTSSRL